MTCREKLKIEHPEKVGINWVGGCSGCPNHYGYADKADWCKGKSSVNYSVEACKRCWNREIDEYITNDINTTKQLVNMIHGYQHGIKKVIFNDPATIVLWSDGTKTVVKCQEGDVFDPEKGLAMAISKKALGNKGNFNEVFKKWLPDDVVECEYPKITMTSPLAEAMIDAMNTLLNKGERKC